jgi:hypothetical protein
VKIRQKKEEGKQQVDEMVLIVFDFESAGDQLSRLSSVEPRHSS